MFFIVGVLLFTLLHLYFDPIINLILASFYISMSVILIFCIIIFIFNVFYFSPYFILLYYIYYLSLCPLFFNLIE